METIHSICCGLDVHQAHVNGCLRRVTDNGGVQTEDRVFDTTVQGLTQLNQWLMEAGCRIAAMESTGVYWKPVYHILLIALEGSFTEHHGLLVKLNPELIDQINSQITQLDQRCEDLLEPMRKEAEQLESIPGVGPRAARIIISEIGTDMSRFGSATRLSSWAGLCPGNNESAGKRKSGKPRKGNRHLRRVLTECSWATRKTDSFLGSTFQRLQKRIGGKKAAVAVAHKILVIVYHLLNEDTIYDDARYDRPRRRQEKRQCDRAVRMLKQLGYDVELKLAA